MSNFFNFFKNRANSDDESSKNNQSNKNSENNINENNNTEENIVVSFAPGFKNYLKTFKVYESLKKSLEKYEELCEKRDIEDNRYGFSDCPYTYNDEHDLLAEISMTMLTAIHNGYIDAFKLQDKNNNNETLGIKIVKLGLKEVAMKVVEDKDCAMIKDDFGFSMPYYAILKNLEPVVTYALQNKDIATQTFGDEEENLGMIAAQHGMENAVIQSLVHKDSCTQQSKSRYNYGKNIGMFAACNKLENATFIALDNEKASSQTDENGNTISMYACKHGISNAIIKSLKHPTYPIQQNNYGLNMGMILASNGNRLSLLALDNKEASLQQDKNGRNIGMICAEKYFEEGVQKALDNIDASCQQDENGKTIGILSAEQRLNGCTKKAAMIKESCEITDNIGRSVLSMAKDQGLEIPDNNLLEESRSILRDLQKDYNFDIEDKSVVKDLEKALFKFEKGINLAYGGLLPDDSFLDSLEDDDYNAFDDYDEDENSL